MHMRRREFVGLLGGAAAATIRPRTSRAQPSSGRVFRIGFLGLPSADNLPKRTGAFRAGVSQSQPIVLTKVTTVVVSAVYLALAPSYDCPEASRLPTSNRFFRMDGT